MWGLLCESFQDDDDERCEKQMKRGGYAGFKKKINGKEEYELSYEHICIRYIKRREEKCASLFGSERVIKIREDDKRHTGGCQKGTDQR